MNLTTYVSCPKELPEISHQQQWMLLGSCFVENMGCKLLDTKFNCCVNPYGVLYNPLSIVEALEEIGTGKTYCAEDLFRFGGMWHSRMHHGSFSDPDQTVALERINRSLTSARAAMEKMEGLLLTFGTAWVYESLTDGRVVGNCHKQPEREFHRRRLSVEETVERCAGLFEKLTAQSPSLHILLTVSPVRHIRDGLRENQLSKSVLLLACDELQRRFPQQVFYFPAYEIMMDELRDYRFYADDLVHPSALAVEYIWEKFCSLTMRPATIGLMERCLKLNKSLAHRPLHPESEGYRLFLKGVEREMEQLLLKYPYIDFDKERELCRTLLNTLPR